MKPELRFHRLILQMASDYTLLGQEKNPDNHLDVVQLESPEMNPWFVELPGAPPSVALEANTSARRRSRLHTVDNECQLVSPMLAGQFVIALRRLLPASP
jgi:hypothetical protein